jgi:trk system potassium uptake protein TrkH
VQSGAPHRVLWDHPLLRSPQALLVAGFSALIALGTVLLWLPFCHSGTQPIGLFEAAFTATSAVCVTGLIVVNTPEAYSFTGQCVILALIQIGGFGIMTFAAMAVDLLGGRLSLRQREALHDAMVQRDAAGEFAKLFRRIVRLTLVIELTGALLLWVPYKLETGLGWGESLFHSLFHAISAFCNAGFALQSTSMERVSWVLPVLSLLIILGGLGHPVLVELWRWIRRPAARPASGLTVHTKVVLWMTGGLLVAGWLGFVFFGTEVTAGADGSLAADQGWAARAWHGWFASVTSRTAGFNSVDMTRMPLPAIFLMVVLMFVGGSPGSCAGGVKTSTVAIAFAELRAGFTSAEDATLFNRRLPVTVVRRALLLLCTAVAWNVVGVVVLCVSEHAALRPDALPEAAITVDQLVFEQFSALGTVGLSIDTTAKLSPVGRVWIANGRGCATLQEG